MDAATVVDSHWLIATTKHYSDAFLIAQHFSRANSRSLEISALGQKGLVILDFKSFPILDEQETFACKFNSQMLKFKFFTNLSAQVIKAFLSLENSKLEENLAFLEFDFLEDAMEAAVSAQSLGIKFVDFRLIRSSQPIVHLIVTDNDSAKLDRLKNHVTSKHFQILSLPTTEIKKFFEIYP